MRGKKVIVIKIGSSTLVTDEGKLDRAYLASLAGDVDALRKAGWSPVIVSSAAIACGLEALGIAQRPTDMPSLQAAASVGQNALMSAYDQAFSRHGIMTSIVLITRHTTARRDSYLHARDTLERLIEFDVVPVINENDTVSVEQIRFGDNDTLAALVACLVQADKCVIFSDIDGLYTANPFTDPDARLISEVTRITPEIIASAGDATSKVGSGGMITKIRAARVLMVAGIELVVCHGRKPGALAAIVGNEQVGTRFSANAAPHDITPRKLWIALGDAARGAVVIDEGAHAALVNRGSSLLCVGVTCVEGRFDADDIIDIKDAEGVVVARGKVAFSSDEAELACGRSREELERNRLLAPLAERALVHRDELIVFE